MIKCPHCGRKIPYDANLCPYCGRSIKQFQQKDLFDDEIPEEMPDIQESDDVVNRPSPLKNDKKFLFFIIAVLLLLLISGLIYHFSSTRDVQTANPSTEVTDSTDTVDVVASTENQASAKLVYQPGRGQKVVVNGDGVRLRFGPSLQAGFLKNEDGGTKSVKKGTRLPCVGEKGDWYEVEYMGKRYYMSKKFTYLVE